jgi:hypothetical protein
VLLNPRTGQSMARAGGSSLTARHWDAAEALTCAGVLCSLGLRVYLPSHVPLALLPVLATVPVWISKLRFFRGATAVVALAAVSILFGLGLSLRTSITHQIGRVELVSELSLVLLTFGGIGVVLWGRSLLGSRQMALLAGIGMCMGALLHGPSGDLNAWKGGLATPVIVVVLALTFRQGIVTIVALLGLAGLCVVFDTRAQAVVLVLAALLVGWQLRPARSNRPASLVKTGFVLMVLGVVAYQLGTQALLHGYLGSEAQQRSLQQVQTAGSLILGGRPEIAATAALMSSRALGYGFGVMPGSADLSKAKEGLLLINYDPNNGYVERFMFGTSIELHSVAGDLWVRTGPVGLVLLVVVIVLLVRGVAHRLPGGSVSGLALFLTLWTGWNLLFSPLLNATLPLTLAVGLALVCHGSAHSPSFGDDDEFNFVAVPADAKGLSPTGTRETRV